MASDLSGLCTLAIDPAATSGWALFKGRDRAASGVARNVTDRFEVIERWLDYAGENSLVRWCVAERWTPGLPSHTAMFGIGANWGRWLECIERTGYREDWILRLEPREWRTAVGIRARGREHAKAAAREAFWYDTGERAETDDEAEAYLIGKAAFLLHKAGSTLPARQKRVLWEGGHVHD